MSIESGDLITRIYSNFRGVDFSNHGVSQYRSPDSKNIWKNYKKLGKCIESRPDIELFRSFNNTIFGLFFYTVNTVEHMIIHCGTSLYDYNMNTKEQKTIKAIGMNPKRSQSFIYNNILYIKDGINYLEYNGEECKTVEGYIPTTSISRKPEGGGTQYQDINLLTGYRKNTFCADGTSKEYYLDTTEIETGKTRCWIDGVETKAFTVNTLKGCITFTTAPNEPNTDGQDNVIIQFCKTIPGYRERITKCTILEPFDNRVFFAGNQDYPNTLFHSSLENPRYVSDTDYYEEGLDSANIRALVAGNNALWVFKEPSQANTTVFYHTPATYDTGKAYPSTHSSISIGCVATGLNFNDDIVLFSDRGMEGISSDVTTEQVLQHRSSLVDSKLLQEENYKNLIVQEYDGYLLVIVDNHIYLANSRDKFTLDNHVEYEWFYWELNKIITYATVKNGILYLCSDDGIYTLTKVNTSIEAYWCTCQDSFDTEQYQKITNKKGCVLNIDGDEISLYVRTDNNEFEKIEDYKNTKGYIIPRIKQKKWKEIQFKFMSNVPFSIYDFTIQSYIGSFVKR